MSDLHDFDKSRSVEDRHAPVLDAWFAEMYPLRKATMDEQWRGIDRVATTPQGEVALDYKCDEAAARTKNLFLETVSNSVTGRPGWMHTSESVWLVYFVVPKTVVMFTFARIRPLLPVWAARYPTRAARNAGYSTLGVCVPIEVATAYAEYVADLTTVDGAVLEPSDRWDDASA